MSNKNEITLARILDEYRELARSNRDLGDAFERLIVAYLCNDPRYQKHFEEVWLWGDWPHRWSTDVGIDIVARGALGSGYCAIQCKFYLPEHFLPKEGIDSFLAASGKEFDAADGKARFTSRIIVSTTDRWSRHAENALAGQTIPCSRIRVQDLAQSPIDWSSYRPGKKKLERRPQKQLRDHQKEALKNARLNFQSHDRGKLIMACGTGKTLTSLKIMEDQVPDKGLVLFLVPSISLLSQVLGEWTAEASSPFHAFAVCSDATVGKDREDVSVHDLALPAATDAQRLAKHAGRAAAERRTVVFSTYQSIQVVADAQDAGLGQFDLIICDEAHRTTGVTLDNDVSSFNKVHENDIVRGKKRLYMTATPRIFTDSAKQKADGKSAVLYSMDDECKYGPEFYRIGFDKAVREGILTDYKVLIIAVNQDAMAEVANQANLAFTLDERQAVTAELAVRIVGAGKGLAKESLEVVDDAGETTPLTEDMKPMGRAVAFSQTIEASKVITEVFNKIIDMLPDERAIHCVLKHVDGKMNALERKRALDWLRDGGEERDCRVLSNVRCLSEGVDVPALDAVIFFDARESIVDIVQSVGRVMRRAADKLYGYIILPVGMPSTEISDYNRYIEQDKQFKSIWKILKALRAHDESLVDEAEIRSKVKIVTGKSRSKESEEGQEQRQDAFNFPPLPIAAISEAVYAAVPAKLGDREYWSNWAKDVGAVAVRIIARIKTLVADNAAAREDFRVFVKGLQNNLNPTVTEEDAVEMLAQHILTLPIFKALFADTGFPENNAVAKSLEAVTRQLDAAAVAGETEGLATFYDNVRETIRNAKSDKSRQDIIRRLYDTFFHNAFPNMAQRLGIVYTPVEVVDFIIHSVQHALEEHFNSTLGDKKVHVLDPFSGAGAFIVRIIQSGLVSKKDLPYKFKNELHANEIILLAYYIATVNIETAFHSQTGRALPYEGMVLADTFQMMEGQERNMEDQMVLPENNALAAKQLEQPIQVIIGNPPYSVGRRSISDNSPNISYPTLDKRIKDSYVLNSSAKQRRSLYDSYIRAIRWASDRIKDKGIIAFVTNGSFLDDNSKDGLRKCLAEEFSCIYVLNLRGNCYTGGEVGKREGANIFSGGSSGGSRATIAISLLIKEPDANQQGQIYYHAIDDYLSRKQKLGVLEEFKSTKNVPWTIITPNRERDWINQRDQTFNGFPQAYNEEDSTASIFSDSSLGASTKRDAWVYNFSQSRLQETTRRMIGTYNEQLERYQKKSATSQQRVDPETVVDKDPKRMSWTGGLFKSIERGVHAQESDGKYIQALFRPFCKQHLLMSKMFIERPSKVRHVFPTPEHDNYVIYCSGTGIKEEFSALVTNFAWDNGKGFPLYWYEPADADAYAPGEVSDLFPGFRPGRHVGYSEEAPPPPREFSICSTGCDFPVGAGQVPAYLRRRQHRTRGNFLVRLWHISLAGIQDPLFRQPEKDVAAHPFRKGLSGVFRGRAAAGGTAPELRVRGTLAGDGAGAGENAQGRGLAREENVFWQTARAEKRPKRHPLQPPADAQGHPRQGISIRCQRQVRH